MLMLNGKLKRIRSSLIENINTHYQTNSCFQSRFITPQTRVRILPLFAQSTGEVIGTSAFYMVKLKLVLETLNLIVILILKQR